MGEFELIADLFAPLATHPGALGLTDDASVLAIPDGHEAVLTKDVMVAGVHFLPDTEPSCVAQKLIRVNLSDLAAMGAEPVGYWLGVQIPKENARAWLTKFVEGLRTDQTAFGISLLGGDTVATPGPIALSLTAMGTVPNGKAITRAGASVGDRIFVSGTIGDGLLGLAVARHELSGLNESDMTYLRGRFECPEPRVKLGMALRGLASALIDVSDGLCADAGHLAKASRVQMVIHADKVPLSAAAKCALAAGHGTMADLLSGGDDYELVFTAPSDRVGEVASIHANVPVTEIGVVIEGKPGVSILQNGQELTIPRAGFTHF